MLISKVLTEVVLQLDCGAQGFILGYKQTWTPPLPSMRMSLPVHVTKQLEGVERKRRREENEQWPHQQCCSVWLRTAPAKQKIPKDFDSETSITCGSSGSWTLLIVRHFHGINVVFIKVLNVTTCPMIRKSYMTWNKTDDSSQPSLMGLQIFVCICFADIYLKMCEFFPDPCR